MENGIDIAIGCDGGHDFIKVSSDDERNNIAIQSRLSSAADGRLRIDGGSSKSSIEEFMTEEGRFFAGDVDTSLPTRYPNYPISAHNRVLVHYALMKAGLGGKRVAICTGLPLRRYFVGGGRPDVDLIDAKKAALMKTDVESVSGHPLATIVDHYIVAECIATYIDYVVVEKDNDIHINTERENERVAIIDVGGRTTDIAVIDDWQVRLSQAVTIDMGMLNVRDILKENLIARFNISINEQQVMKAFKTGQVKIQGRLNDVRDLVRESVRDVVNQIKAEVMRVLGDGSDIDTVLLTGGGMHSLAKFFDGLHPNQILASNPQYSNARGMRKFAKLMLKRKSENKEG